MKRFFLLLAGIPLVVYPWVRTYGFGTGYSVQQTLDGGYIVVGSAWDSVSDTVGLYLLKTDAKGDTLWTKLYAGSQVGYCVRQTSDGGYIIVGETWSFGAGGADLWLLKTDEYGDTLWTKTYGWGWEDAGRWVEQTSDGGYIITGTSQPTGSGRHLWLLKTDEYGDTIWTQIYMMCSHGYCVQQTNDNDYIIGTNFVLIKTDSIGDTLWTSPYGAPSVRQTTDGGYIMATSHYKDVWIIKTDTQGDTMWTKTYGGEDEEYSYDVQQTSEGGYAVVGETHSFATVTSGSNVWLLKTDANGDTLWTRVLEPGIGRSVQQTTDGGYIITGNAGVLLLIKTDSLGYAGVTEEPPVATETHPDWRILGSVGRQIVLQYENRPQGFAASIFNAAGQKVGELHSASPSGTITWGEGFAPGVYFIKPTGIGASRRVVLIR